MINYVVGFFRLLAIVFGFIFNPLVLLLINLPIIASARIIYVALYYLKYIKPAERTSETLTSSVYSKNEKLYFFGKNLAIILIGILNIYIALFFAMYSLLCACIYIVNIGTDRNNNKIKLIGKISLLACPVGFIIFYTLFTDLIAIGFVIASIILFIVWGFRYAKLSPENLFKRYNKRIFIRIPAYIQYILIGLLIIPITVIGFGLNLFGLNFFVALAPLVESFFNLNFILIISLPFIGTSRLLYSLAIYNNYIKYSQEKDKLYTKWQKAFIIITNSWLFLLSLIVVYFALFFAIYSCLMAADIYKKLLNTQNQPIFKNLQIISLALAPAFLVMAIIFFFHPIGLILMGISVGLSIFLYFYRMKKFSTFNLKEYKQILSQKFSKAPKVFKYFVIIYVFVEPTIIITGTYTIGTFPRETYYIEMTDGTKLATDVFYSSLAWDFVSQKPLPAPVILVRTSYGKNQWADLGYGLLFNTQGYHMVVQDLRGTFDSEGAEDTLLFTKSYSDGVDTIDWILSQEWCNGKIGSAGASALGINQYLYAGMSDAYKPHGTGLKCQSVWVATPDLYLDCIMEGAFHDELINSWLRSTARDNWKYQRDKIYELVNTQDLSSDYYKHTTLSVGPNQYSNVNAEAIHVGGWYDLMLRGTIRAYENFDDNGGINARGKQALIIGPWTHGAVYGIWQGSLTYPDTSNGIPLIIDWEDKLFSSALKGEDNDLWGGNRVAYYLMGDVDDPNVDANYWKYTTDWPLDFTWNEWYIGINQNNDNVLVDNETALTGINEISYLHDPSNPVLTIGGNNLGGMNGYGSGPHDQSIIESRSDVIVFDSEILTEPYTVEGDLKMKIHFKSNCTDTDFMVRLCDVYPDGKSMLIIDGARMARLRKDMYSMNFLTPGQEYSMDIDLIATAYQFNTGHKIRVSISSSNYPRFAVNYNTGGPITYEEVTNYHIARNTIITGPGKTCIYLPELN